VLLNANILKQQKCLSHDDLKMRHISSLKSTYVFSETYFLLITIGTRWKRR